VARLSCQSKIANRGLANAAFLYNQCQFDDASVGPVFGRPSSRQTIKKPSGEVIPVPLENALEYGPYVSEKRSTRFSRSTVIINATGSIPDGLHSGKLPHPVNDFSSRGGEKRCYVPVHGGLEALNTFSFQRFFKQKVCGEFCFGTRARALATTPPEAICV